MSKALVQRYFDAFNAGDIEAMLECLSDDVAHHVNEGEVRHGKDAFRQFCMHMSRCYHEQLSEMVVFLSPEGARAAAEYVVSGKFLQADEGLPQASGQTYRLPAGSFFELKDSRITRVTTYYNLADWMRQIRR